MPRPLVGALAAMTVVVVSLGVAPAGGAPAPGGRGDLAAAPGGPPAPGLALAREFADPAILRDGTSYVAYSTESGGLNIPTITSTDLRTWSAPVDALPTRPGWGRSGPVWAPSVLRQADGTYLLAYSARHDATRQMCVSVGTADRATGPFVDRSTGPLVCEHARGGSIDPSFFLAADGTTWLLWKSEGIPNREPPHIFSQRFDPAGLGLMGTATRLLTQDLPWEYPIIENPAMTVIDGVHVLLYSANRWETSSYATGWAVCEGPVGPCRKAAFPIMTTDAKRSGPGGASWFTTPDGLPWIVYHGWKDGRAGHPNGGQRALYLAKPRYKDGVLRVAT